MAHKTRALLLREKQGAEWDQLWNDCPHPDDQRVWIRGDRKPVISHEYCKECEAALRKKYACAACNQEVIEAESRCIDAQYYCISCAEAGRRALPPMTIPEGMSTLLKYLKP